MNRLLAAGRHFLNGRSMSRPLVGRDSDVSHDLANKRCKNIQAKSVTALSAQQMNLSLIATITAVILSGTRKSRNEDSLYFLLLPHTSLNTAAWCPLQTENRPIWSLNNRWLLQVDRRLQSERIDRSLVPDVPLSFINTSHNTFHI